MERLPVCPATIPTNTIYTPVGYLSIRRASHFSNLRIYSQFCPISKFDLDFGFAELLQPFPRNPKPRGNDKKQIAKGERQ
ncbi:MAG: hypothetical protein IJO10_05190 [Clostridia bacterium]|nr:hypothetical protein [Clostridia bacterium]